MTGEKLEAPNISRVEFAQSLSESGLFDSAELLPDSALPGALDGAGAARELIATGKLTAYQADALLHRRFADLRMGNYVILDRLGAGGMGTVFKGQHRRMKRVVALKVLSRGAEKFASRFQREVETIARLSHPNIVMAYDADESEAGPFLVMEFVNGRDLATVVADGGPMPVGVAVDNIIQAARGLEYAHLQGIIHRDIKPGNLLRDTEGVVKVADLGLARLNDPENMGAGASSLTQAGTVFGTVDYMSPEQAVDSGAVDPRADVYSLGCTLYFLLTARPPYQAGSLMAILVKHRESPVPSLRDVRADVPPELDAAFRHMLAKRPEERCESMAAVIRELEAARTKLGSLDVSPIAQPTSPTLAHGLDHTVELSSPLAAGPDAGNFSLTASVAEPTSSGNPLAGLTVVLVESSRTQAGIIRKYLQQLGIDPVHITGSGREAIETVKRTGANVLISSLHLSDMTGSQLAVALRAEPQTASVGFVLATSENVSELTAEFAHDSRTAVMLKPFDSERLAHSISSVSMR